MTCKYSNEDCHWRRGSKGMCSFHYARHIRGQDPSAPKRTAGTRRNPTPKECACGNVAYIGSLCRSCYNLKTKLGLPIGSEASAPCPFKGCPTLVRGGVNHGLCKSHYHVTWRFSIAAERLVELSHNYRCGNPGCGLAGDLNGRALHLDHNHSCCPPGKYGTSSKVSCGECVRGWLCGGCNAGLGMLQENPQKIRGLLAYLGV